MDTGCDDEAGEYTFDADTFATTYTKSKYALAHKMPILLSLPCAFGVAPYPPQSVQVVSLASPTTVIILRRDKLSPSCTGLSPVWMHIGYPFLPLLSRMGNLLSHPGGQPTVIFPSRGAESSSKGIGSPFGGSLGWVQDSLGIREGRYRWICGFAQQLLFAAAVGAKRKALQAQRGPKELLNLWPVYTIV